MQARAVAAGVLVLLSAVTPLGAQDIITRLLGKGSVKVEMTVVDKASWDVKVVRRSASGSLRGGVVTLTARVSVDRRRGHTESTSTSFVVVQPGGQATIMIADRVLFGLILGNYSGLRVKVNKVEGEEVDLDVFAAGSTSQGELTIATGVRVKSGEALVVAGAEENESGTTGRRAGQQIAILKATVTK